MITNMMHRSAGDGSSVGSAAQLKRRFGSRFKIFGKPPSVGDDNWRHPVSSTTDSEPNESILGPRSPDSNASNVFLDNPENNLRQLRALVQRMRSAPSGHNHVDAANKEFVKIKDQASALCRVILQEELRRTRDISNDSDINPRPTSPNGSPRSPGAVFDTRSSFSGRSLAEVMTGSSAGRHILPNETWLSVIRDWKNCIEQLNVAFRANLTDTYRSYERGATPEMVNELFANKRFRRNAIAQMRNASVTRLLSADPQFFHIYEIWFRDYEKAKQELREIQHLLQAAESGISPERVVKEYDITLSGDAVLEFSNVGTDHYECDPVLRFRVSSHMLAETSPIFARMFSGNQQRLHLYDDDDIMAQLPLPPTRYVCKDGTEAKLYRMPQIELNRHGSMEILLNAAHMRHEKVPREVTFEQFVAIAECCLNYKCTSPLELMVEHRWLPQWMHKGADSMPDGLLVISYTFGLRQLFARTSKTAIMNIADEKELLSKPWPSRIKDKIWAVRCAKVAQVYACCLDLTKEFLRPPPPSGSTSPDLASLDLSNNHHLSTATPKLASLTSTPRCPKGSHWCDATNLGWMMLIYNEMNLLGHIMRPDVLSHLPNAQSESRSLAQVVDLLRRVPSPPTPVHRGGVCDPAPTFRSAVSDIYNSISGLTLYDVSGKSHGWALSKHFESEPQTQLGRGLERMAASDPGHSVATEFPEAVRLKILSYLEEIDDLQAAAMANHAFYETYKKKEVSLIRNILRSDRRHSSTTGQMNRRGSGDGEPKVPKTVSDIIKANPGSSEYDDAATIRTETDDDASDMESDDDISMYSPPTPSGQRSIRTGDPAQSDSGRIETPNGHSSELASPTTPRQIPQSEVPVNDASSSPSTVASAGYVEGPPMTHEEANRILWPEEAIEAIEAITPSPPGQAMVGEVVSEKFLASDFVFHRLLENKTLAPPDDKQLRSEVEKRLKGNPQEGGSSTGKQS